MLKNIFKKPKGIKARFIITFIVLASIPLSIAGVYGIYYSVEALEKTTLYHLEYELSSKANDIEKFLYSVHRDVLFLSRSNAIKELVEFNGRKDSSDFVNLRFRLEQELFTFSQTRPYYYQIRYISNDGYEVVRVDSDSKKSTAVPFENLQYKGDRYYFTDSMKYPRDQCYVSPMDLNIEKGAIELPHKPVVRFATPIFDRKDQKRGIVIINLYASYIIEQMKSLDISKGGKTFVVNKEGYYLSHLKSHEKASQFELGSTTGMASDYSSDVVTATLSGKPGTIKISSEIISYAPILTGDTISGQYWVLALVYPKKAIFAPISRLEIIFTIIGFFAVLFASIIGVWMARRFTGPILKLHQGVEWIAEGDFDHRLDIATGDEIEVLAERFNSMTGKVKTLKEKMEGWNEELKREVEKRTKELEIEKHKIENILMCASEGIIVADEEDKIIILNPSAESILGVKKGDIIGKEILDCHKEPEISRLIRITEQVGAAPVTLTTVIGTRVLEISVTVMSYNGKKSGSMMVMRDITERQRLMEERMTMEKQLFHADKLVSLGELSAGIAHEIGNPLAAIKTVIQAADEETPFRGKQKKYMERILKEVDRLSFFLRTFSTFANPGVKHSARSRVEEVIKDVLFLIRNEAMKHDIKIDEKIGRDLSEVRMEPNRLKQVFMNLFLNAIQAMGEGGKITISAERLNEVNIMLSVSDTGVGIPQENIEKIFYPFFTTKPNGTGLGLSIVHRIVTEHGGNIKVHSKVGMGTMFDLTLHAERRRKDRENTKTVAI